MKYLKFSELVKICTFDAWVRYHQNDLKSSGPAFTLHTINKGNTEMNKQIGLVLHRVRHPQA